MASDSGLTVRYAHLTFQLHPGRVDGAWQVSIDRLGIDSAADIALPAAVESALYLIKDLVDTGGHP